MSTRRRPGTRQDTRPVPAGTKEHLSPRPPDPEGHGETPPGPGRGGRAGGVYRLGPPAGYGDTSGGTVPWPRRVSVGGPQAEHSRPGRSDKDKSISHPPQNGARS